MTCLSIMSVTGNCVRKQNAFEALLLLSHRLKLETLTDKDSTIQVLDSDDEGDSAEIQSTRAPVPTEKARVNEENEPHELHLTPSQSSGHELPGSQPQPIAAQVIMEEDNLNIEEYDSD